MQNTDSDNFTKEVNGDITTISVHLIRATMRDIEEFKNILLKEIEHGNSKIIVDLYECEFIDSTFLGTLVLGLKMCEKKEGSLKLVASNSITQSIIQLTGAGKILQLYSTRQEAADSLNN